MSTSPPPAVPGTPNPAGGAPRPGQGPFPVPAGSRIEPRTLIKFTCFCGQKVSLEYRRYGQAGSCPRCGAELGFPDVTRSDRVRVQCPCGAPWSREERACPGCGGGYFRPGEVEEPVPAPSAPGPAPAALPAATKPAASPVARAARRVCATLAVVLVAIGLIRGIARRVRRPVPERDVASPIPAAPVEPPGNASAAPPRSAAVADRPGPADPAPAALLLDPPADPDRRRPPEREPDPSRTPARVAEPRADPAATVESPRRPPAVAADPPAAPGETRWERMSRHRLPPRPPPDARTPAADATDRPARVPDAAFFGAKVLPLLDRLCASCHAQSRLPVGKWRMTPPGRSGHTATTRKNNYSACLPFLDAAEPERSPLIRKALALAEGGSEHGGGDNLRRGDDAFAVLSAFARGESAAAVRPVADAGGDRWAEVGKAARFDGGKSRDPAGHALQHRWTLAVHPPGSKADLQPLSAAEVSLRPDRAGVYLLELTVEDATRQRSDPCRARLYAFPAPAKRAGAAVPAARLRAATEAFWGRAPTEEEETVLRRADAAWTAAGIVRHDAFWRALIEADLGHLDLTGAFRPEPFDAERLAVHLAGMEIDPIEVLRRILGDAALARRYPDSRDAEEVLAARLLGEPPGEPTPGETPAARADRILGRPEFRALWLERHHRRLRFAAPDPAAMARWTEAWAEGGAGLERVFRAWVESILR